MGNATPDKKAWQHVVDEKRRIQAETLARFVTQEETVTLARDEALSNGSGIIRSDQIVAHLTSRASSCEALVKSYIQQ